MKSNRKITALILAGLTALTLTACGASESTSQETASETAAHTTAAADETKVAITEPAVPTEPVDLEKGLTDTMYERALLNQGNKSRLAKAMNKAKNGEAVTIGVIGGSITQGSTVTSHNNCYAERFHTYWAEKFPESELNFVNAGIGGTDSYLGVHRVDTQLLNSDPDVVIVEFSVNDGDKVMNKYSYDSLVRKIMADENSPAVILLFTTQENGTSLQDVHKEIGFAYDLPMLSYREVVYPEVAAGTLDWKKISPDNIHPNDEGHKLIGQLLSRYLDSVYDELDSISADDIAMPEKSYTADYYKNAKLLGASEITAAEINGFEVGGNSVYPQLFPDNFITEGEGYIRFETECRCLGIFYLKQTDGKGGKYEVYIDGERKGIIDADFSGGWGNYGLGEQVLLSKEKAAHTVEIKLAEGSTNTALTILGIFES